MTTSGFQRGPRIVSIPGYLVLTIIFLTCLTGNASAFDPDVFSLEEEPLEVQWLTLPDGWLLYAGVNIGIAGEELIIQVPRDEANPPDVSEFDWPFRLIFNLPPQTDAKKAKVDEKFYPGISALIDYFSLEQGTGSWTLTLYMQEPLTYRIEQGVDILRVRVRFLGSIWKLLQQENSWRLWNVVRYVPQGVQNAYIVQMDPRRPDMSVRLGYAGFADVKSATLADFVKFAGAIGGVNGGYFSGGMPLGLLYINDRVIAPPLLSRPCLALGAYGTPYIGNFKAVCTAKFKGKGEIEIETINDFHYSGVVLLTPGHPERVRGELGGMKVVIEDGVVTGITGEPLKDLSNKTIVWDPYNTSPLLRGVSIGDEVSLRYSFSGFPFKPEYILQAGPMLVKDGAMVNDFTLGSFLQGITQGRSPRTAAAVTVHGEFLLFMGDGRLSLHSIGFSLKEVAEVLIQGGAVDAINFDGGSSSSIFVDGEYYGYPYAGRWKAVPDAILFGAFEGFGESVRF